MIPYGVMPARVRLSPDSDYPLTLRALIEKSTRYCLCSLFIVDLLPAGDPDLLVHEVFRTLQGALWRGVDTRLLIGGSRTNLDIAERSVTARSWAEEHGIPVRWLTAQAVRGSHVKLVVADDYVLTGSHNWSGGAFTDQTQDSVLVQSAALATRFVHLFDGQWLRAEHL